MWADCRVYVTMSPTGRIFWKFIYTCIYFSTVSHWKNILEVYMYMYFGTLSEEDCIFGYSLLKWSIHKYGCSIYKGWMVLSRLESSSLCTCGTSRTSRTFLDWSTSALNFLYCCSVVQLMFRSQPLLCVVCCLRRVSTDLSLVLLVFYFQLASSNHRGDLPIDK